MADLKPSSVTSKNVAQRDQHRRNKQYIRLLEQLEFAVKSKHEPGIKLALEELAAFRSV